MTVHSNSAQIHLALLENTPTGDPACKVDIHNVEHIGVKKCQDEYKFCFDGICELKGHVYDGYWRLVGDEPMPRALSNHIIGIQIRRNMVRQAWRLILGTGKEDALGGFIGNHNIEANTTPGSPKNHPEILAATMLREYGTVFAENDDFLQLDIKKCTMEDGLVGCCGTRNLQVTGIKQKIVLAEMLFRNVMGQNDLRLYMCVEETAGIQQRKIN